MRHATVSLNKPKGSETSKNKQPLIQEVETESEYIVIYKNCAVALLYTASINLTLLVKFTDCYPLVPRLVPLQPHV